MSKDESVWISDQNSIQRTHQHLRRQQITQFQNIARVISRMMQPAAGVDSTRQ